MRVYNMQKSNTVHLHQGLKCIHFGIVCLGVLVFTAKSPRMEMRTSLEVRYSFYFWTKLEVDKSWMRLVNRRSREEIIHCSH